MIGAAGAVRVICPVGVFAAREREMRAQTEALNRATSLAEKMGSATLLQAAAEDLLACPDRDADNVSCRMCREFSRLRANTAGLILRATRLAS